ncbi:hypothetical protein, partial [Azospirillum brasilense]|uniref:hypothetical protein n=1 Tax=Azospirillum brasilense TaxID=192 RepID=UPI001B3BC7BB
VQAERRNALLTGPLNATSTQAFETVRLLLLDRDAQATRDASPTPEPVRGQRSKPPPAHPFSIFTINNVKDPSPGEPQNTTSGELAVVVIGFLKAGEAQTIVRASGGSI